MRIGRRRIGDSEPCYLVAEIGNNHNGSLDQARAMIRAFARAGAHAVKFQTFVGADIVAPVVPSDAYAGWDVPGRFDRWIDFLDSLVLPRESYPELIALAHDLGLEFISTPLTVETAEFLAEAGVDAIKVASMDLNHLPFIEAVARLDLPVILSTGMSRESEIDEAVRLLGPSLAAVLHCVSNYPLQRRDANLRNITAFRARYGVPVGFSDHSLGIELDIAAVALGASLIEKHVTLDRASPVRAEHHFATEPEEFRVLASAVEGVREALGTETRELGPEEERNRREFRRSLFLARDIEPGETIRVEDIRCVRPGTSVEPRCLNLLPGARARRRIRAFEPFTLDDVFRDAS